MGNAFCFCDKNDPNLIKGDINIGENQQDNNNNNKLKNNQNDKKNPESCTYSNSNHRNENENEVENENEIDDNAEENDEENNNENDQYSNQEEEKGEESEINDENINKLVFTFNSDFCSLCIIMLPSDEVFDKNNKENGIDHNEIIFTSEYLYGSGLMYSKIFIDKELHNSSEFYKNFPDKDNYEYS